MREERYHIALDKYDKNIVINALNTLRMGHCDTTSSVLRFIILKIPKMMKRRASASLAGRRPAKQNAHSVPFWNQMSEKSRLICLHHHGRIDPSHSL